MSALTLIRMPLVPTAAQLQSFREVVLGIVNGMSDDDRRAWQRFWSRLFKLEPGEIVRCEVTIPRNAVFHRKFFAMLSVSFDAWEPDAGRVRRRWKGHTIAKNLEQFRRDVTILAGYYDVHYALDGSLQPSAKSISFANMDDVEFERVYSAVANVILQRVLTRYTRADLDEHVDRLLSFV